MASQPIQGDEGILTFPFSSTLPGRQYFGTEILSHEPGSINFERMNAGSAPHLWNHDRDKVLGINQRGWLENGRGFSQVKFDLEDEYSRKVYERIQRGFLPNVSTFYDINDWEEMLNEETQKPYVLVRKWTPLETSTVSIPVDHTVGAGRNIERIIWTPTQSQATINNDNGGSIMNPEDTIQETRALTDDDLQAARAQARKEESERMTGLRALERNFGDRHPAVKAKLEEAMDLGWDVDSARMAISDIILGDSASRPPIQAPPGRAMSNEEGDRDYSLFRAIKGATESKTPAELRKIAPFESEVSDRIAEQMGRGTSGLFIPINDLTFDAGQALRGQMHLTSSGRASFAAGTPTQAGNLIDTGLRPEMLLEYLFNKPVVSQLGATRISGLRENFDFPVEDASTLGIDWLAEDAPALEKNTTFTLKGMRPKTAAAHMRVTRQMLLQSEIAMEPYLRSRLGIAMMLGTDAAALFGSGTANQPRGILNYPGVNTVALGTNGAAPTWESIVQMETLINDQNADIAQMGYVTNSRGKGTLKVTPKTPVSVPSGSFVTSEFLWSSNTDTDMLNGYRAMCSNQIPKNLTKGTGTNLSAIIFGAWNQLMIGQWGVVEIMTNPYADTDFLRGALKVRIFFTMDVQVGYEKAFTTITDMITQ
jgi:HK97 family phage major capsid protein